MIKWGLLTPWDFRNQRVCSVNFPKFSGIMTSQSNLTSEAAKRSGLIYFSLQKSIALNLEERIYALLIEWSRINWAFSRPKINTAAAPFATQFFS